MAKQYIVTSNKENKTKLSEIITSNYSSTGEDAVDGKAIAAALDKLDYNDEAEDGKYVASISEENGIITVTRAELPIIPGHTEDDIQKPAAANEGQVLTFDGVDWIAKDPQVGEGADGNTTYTLVQDEEDGHKLTFISSDSAPIEIIIPDNDTTYENATQTNAGLMSAEDKVKLDTLVDNDTTYEKATQETDGLMSKEDKAKLDTLVDNDTTYTLTQDEENKNKLIFTPSDGEPTEIEIPAAASSVEYSAGDGVIISEDNKISVETKIIDITEENYNKLSKEDKENPKIYYNIIDVNNIIGGYNLPFRFGINEYEDYGYYKDGLFIPFPGQISEYKWFDNGTFYNIDKLGEPLFRTNDNGLNNKDTYNQDGYLKLYCTGNNPSGSGVESMIYTSNIIPKLFNKVKISFILHRNRGEDVLDFKFGISKTNDSIINANSALLHSPSISPSSYMQEYELDISNVTGYFYIGCCAIADVYDITFYHVT